MFNSVLHYINNYNIFLKKNINFFSSNIKFILITDTRFSVRKAYLTVDKKHKQLVYIKKKNQIINLFKKKYDLVFESSMKKKSSIYNLENMLFLNKKKLF